MTTIQIRIVRSLALCLLLLLIILGLLISNQFWLTKLQSDVLFIVSLYQDLFVDHYSLSGWNMPGALYLFPDVALLLSLLCMIPEIGYSYVAYSISFFFLILAALTAIAFNLNKQEYAGLLNRFFYPNSHSGPILIGFVLTAVFMRVLENGYSRASATAFFILSYLGILSEIIIVPQFLLPFILSVLIFNLLGLLHRRILLITVALTAAAQLASWCTLQALALGKIITLHNLYYRYSFDLEVLLKTSNIFLRDMKYYMEVHGILFGILGVWLVISTYLLVRNRHYLCDAKNNYMNEGDLRYRILFLIVFSVISVLGTIAAPIAINRWVGRFSMHYAQLLYIWPLFSLSIMAASYKGKYVPWLKLALFVILFFGLFMILPGTKKLDLARLKLPYPKSIECLDKLAEIYNLHYGYGRYWHARYITILSRRGVRVNQVWLENLTPREWFNNRAWFCAAPKHAGGRYPKYDFIMVTPSTRATIEEKFGKPAHKEYCYGIEANVYNRESDIAFRNFLRLPAYIALGRELPSSPVSPESLGIFKPEGASWEAPGNVIIPEDGKLVARFDPPVANEIIEIAADGDDEYSIHFLSGETVLGSLIVPLTSKPDIQIRYLRLPEAVRNKSFDRLEIQPSKGDGHYSVGHIFLYDDSY
jgi:hypothetical protein